MQSGEVYCPAAADEIETTSRGRILLIDDDAIALEARSASLRREGHEVRAFASVPEGLSCLESEHFDLIALKTPGLEPEQFWTVSSGFTTGGPSHYWHAASTGLVTWMWRTWEVRAN